RAVVGGMVDGTAGAIDRRILIPGRTLGVPGGRVQARRLRGVAGQVYRACVLVYEERLFPALATIGGEEDPALLVRAPDMAEGRDHDPVGVLRIHEQATDLLGIVQPQVPPGLAAVVGTVHAVAVGGIGTDRRFPSADVDDLRIGRRDADGTDGAHWLVLEQRLPGDARVRCLEEAAVHGAEIGDIELAGDTVDGIDASAAIRAYLAPGQRVQERRRHRLGSRRAGGEQQGSGKQGSEHGHFLGVKGEPCVSTPGSSGTAIAAVNKADARHSQRLMPYRAVTRYRSIRLAPGRSGATRHSEAAIRSAPDRLTST